MSITFSYKKISYFNLFHAGDAPGMVKFIIGSFLGCLKKEQLLVVPVTVVELSSSDRRWPLNIITTSWMTKECSNHITHPAKKNGSEVLKFYIYILSIS